MPLFQWAMPFMLSWVGGAAVAEPPRRPPPPPPDERPFPGDGPRERFRRGGSDGAPGSPESAEPVPWDRLPEPERARVRRFMGEHFPRLAVEMDRLRESSPRRYERRMSRIGADMRRLMEVMERDPRRGIALVRERQVAFQIHQLIMEYHATSDETKRTELRGRIRETVTAEFEARMSRRAEEVRAMESQLVELRGRLKEMESLREELILRRVRELLENPPPAMRPPRPIDSHDDDDSPENPPPPRMEPP